MKKELLNDEEEIIVEKFIDLMVVLNIGFSIKKLRLPILEQLDLDKFIIEFQDIKDLNYLAWSMLDNAPEEYFDERYISLLKKSLSNNTIGMLIIDHTQFKKTVEMLESLLEANEINEWQSPLFAIEKFKECYPEHEYLDETIKYRSIRHFAIWSDEYMIELIEDLLSNLNELGLTSYIIFDPINKPYFGELIINEAELFIPVINTIRKHDKYPDLNAIYQKNFEDLITSMPDSDESLRITFDQKNFIILTDIIKSISQTCCSKR